MHRAFYSVQAHCPLAVNHYISKLSHSLNHAIAVSMKRNPTSPKSQFIRAIILAKGVHFYGFHASYSPFLKVYLADPNFVNRAVTILQSGTVMKTRFRVYESHINFILQFMCDFGLYGCGWMDLGDVWERGTEDPLDDLYESDGRHEQDGHQDKPKFKPSPYFRQSRMPLEVDAAAHQILNRHRLSARNIHHRLSIPGPPLPSEPLVLSVRELWEDERQRRTAKGLSPSPEIPKDPSENSRGRGAAWVAEARWWDEIRKRIERERGKEKVLHSGRNWERWVMSTFESIEALWEDEYKTWKPSLLEKSSGEEDVPAPEHDGNRIDDFNPYAATQTDTRISAGAAREHMTEVDVDEELLSSQVMERLVQEAETWERIRGDFAERDDNAPNDVEAAEDGPPPENQAYEREATNR